MRLLIGITIWFLVGCGTNEKQFNSCHESCAKNEGVKFLYCWPDHECWCNNGAVFK